MSKSFSETLMKMTILLNDAGINMFMYDSNYPIFHIHVCRQVVIRTNDLSVVENIIQDWHKGVASFFGVSVTHLKKWIEAKKEVYPQCMAYTKKGKGKRCSQHAWSKNYKIPNDPSEWNSETPVYCPVHDGGEK